MRGRGGYGRYESGRYESGRYESGRHEAGRYESSRRRSRSRSRLVRKPEKNVDFRSNISGEDPDLAQEKGGQAGAGSRESAMLVEKRDIPGDPKNAKERKIEIKDVNLVGSVPSKLKENILFYEPSVLCGKEGKIISEMVSKTIAEVDSSKVLVIEREVDSVLGEVSNGDTKARVTKDRFKNLEVSLKEARRNCSSTKPRVEGFRKLNEYEVGHAEDKASEVFEQEEREENEMGVFDEDEMTDDMKVTGNLARYKDYWHNTGCSDFVYSVVTEGYKPVFKETPRYYREKNNKSWEKHNTFGVQAVLKLKENGRIVEVGEKDLVAINPLSVAVHPQTKKLRLCLDQSRHVNKDYSVPRKFRIESTDTFKQVVETGGFMVCFDLKSAYHHIQLNQEYWKYFGFSCIIEGRERFFAFVCLPFGFYDSARVITKVLRHVLEKWRKDNVTAFIHIDDGILTGKTKRETEVVADLAKSDLAKFGFITSEEKCCWSPVQILVWTGVEWDLEKFVCRVPQVKVEKAESKIQSLITRKDKELPVKDLASVCGLLMSFRHGMGEDLSRFYTRRMSIQIAQETEDNKWSRDIILREDVLEELWFWLRNLRRLNGFRIRQKEEVVTFDCQGGSDAGGHQVGGALVEELVPVQDSVFKSQLTE